VALPAAVEVDAGSVSDVKLDAWRRLIVQRQPLAQAAAERGVKPGTLVGYVGECIEGGLVPAELDLRNVQRVSGGAGARGCTLDDVATHIFGRLGVMAEVVSLLTAAVQAEAVAATGMRFTWVPSVLDPAAAGDGGGALSQPSSMDPLSGHPVLGAEEEREVLASLRLAPVMARLPDPATRDYGALKLVVAFLRARAGLVLWLQHAAQGPPATAAGAIGGAGATLEANVGSRAAPAARAACAAAASSSAAPVAADDEEEWRAAAAFDDGDEGMGGGNEEDEAVLARMMQDDDADGKGRRGAASSAHPATRAQPGATAAAGRGGPIAPSAVPQAPAAAARAPVAAAGGDDFDDTLLADPALDALLAQADAAAAKAGAPSAPKVLGAKRPHADLDSSAGGGSNSGQGSVLGSALPPRGPGAAARGGFVPPRPAAAPAQQPPAKMARREGDGATSAALHSAVAIKSAPGSAGRSAGMPSPAPAAGNGSAVGSAAAPPRGGLPSQLELTTVILGSLPTNEAGLVTAAAGKWPQAPTQRLAAQVHAVVAHLCERLDIYLTEGGTLAAL
jgi:hypothetical protein